jgi:hypothetical protein
MKNTYNTVLIFVCLIWAGMVAGISFLEAPVKFTAPSLTLRTGLDVGRHVFGAFNKVEIVFVTVLSVIVFMGKCNAIIKALTGGVVFIMIMECFWLLPVLDERALMIIAGNWPTGNSPHGWYIFFEFAKFFLLTGLAWFGIKQLKEYIRTVWEVSEAA